jgi:inosine/xanthosine triphosphatase
MKKSNKIVAVASHNPVKVEAVLNGFQRLFPNENWTVNMADVPSGVSDQPMTEKECLAGARNRAKNVKEVLPNADYWVGVEGGCDYLENDLVAFAWIVVLGKENSGCARTASFQLPKQVQERVESGMELGEADDQVFGRSNSKQKSGAVGLLTRDVITRTSLYEMGVILALVPFKRPDLYPSPESI